MIYLQIAGLAGRRFLDFPKILRFYMELATTSSRSLSSVIDLGEACGLTPAQVLFELGLLLRAGVFRTTGSCPVPKEEHSFGKIPRDLLTLGLYTALVAHEPFANIPSDAIETLHDLFNKVKGEPLTATMIVEFAESRIVIDNNIVDTDIVVRKGFPKHSFGYTRMALVPISLAA